MGEQMKRKVIATLFAAGMTIGGVMATAGTASAKITPRSCENGGGQLPPGQQPTCKGGGLDQNPATNPAGHEPPGQN
jgi:hypothetical protein